MGLEKIIEKKKEVVREKVAEELEKAKEMIEKKRYLLRVFSIKNIAILVNPLDLNHNEIILKSAINLAKRLRAAVCVCSLALRGENIDILNENMGSIVRYLENAGIHVEKSEVIASSDENAVKSFLSWAKENQCQLIVMSKKYRLKEEQRTYSWFAERIADEDHDIPIIFVDKTEITEEYLDRALVLISFRELKYPNVELALSICGEGEIHLLSVIESSEVASLAKSMEISSDEAISKIREKRLNSIKNLANSIRSIVDADIKEHIEVGEVISVAREYYNELRPILTYVNRSVRPGEIGTHLLLLIREIDPIVMTPMK